MLRGTGARDGRLKEEWLPQGFKARSESASFAGHGCGLCVARQAGGRTRGWHGRRSAWLAVIGFVIVLFTLVGVNLLIAGLHSYAGV